MSPLRVLTSAGKLLDDQGRVMSAKPEGVGEGDVHVSPAGVVGHVVEVALWVGMLVVDRRRHNAIPDGEHRDDGLDPAGCANEVPGHGLG